MADRVDQKKMIREFSMQNLAERIKKHGANDRDLQSRNGLQNLVVYYQKLFDIQENVDHYSPIDYQNAKRSFIKYLLKKRAL